MTVQIYSFHNSEVEINILDVCGRPFLQIQANMCYMMQNCKYCPQLDLSCVGI